MQENKEYHRTGITEAIAEDAIHIMEGDEAIIHDPPESHIHRICQNQMSKI